jgi:hypothetical protein
MAKKVVKKATVLKPRNGGTMTEAQFFGRIRALLRNGFRYWKPMQLALKAASRPSQNANKRLRNEYMCNACKNWFPRANVEIDHIIECGSLKTYQDIVPFIQRLTPENINAFQILCKPCHMAKTIKNKTK